MPRRAGSGGSSSRPPPSRLLALQALGFSRKRNHLLLLSRFLVSLVVVCFLEDPIDFFEVVYDFPNHVGLLKREVFVKQGSFEPSLLLGNFLSGMG